MRTEIEKALCEALRQIDKHDDAEGNTSYLDDASDQIRKALKLERKGRIYVTKYEGGVQYFSQGDIWTTDEDLAEAYTAEEALAYHRPHRSLVIIGG